MSELTRHPISAAFPDMPIEEFQELKDSIENLGVLDPITVYEGQVLDGWATPESGDRTQHGG